jgi:hypothetical protein
MMAGGVRVRSLRDISANTTTVMPDEVNEDSEGTDVSKTVISGIASYVTPAQRFS